MCNGVYADGAVACIWLHACDGLYALLFDALAVASCGSLREESYCLISAVISIICEHTCRFTAMAERGRYEQKISKGVANAQTA